MAATSAKAAWSRKCELLASFSLFEPLSPIQRQDLARHASLASYRKGQPVFSEGDPALGLHIVAQGLVKVSKLSPEGKEQILTHFGPGEPIGEAAVFSGGSFPASATAVTPALVLSVPRREILELISRDPQVAVGMLAVLSRRLQVFARLIEDLSLNQVSARLARYLQEAGAGDPGSLRLALPKAQLALRLGTTAETLSRTLTRMKEAGVISLQGRRIKVLDPEALRGLAAGAKL